MSRCSLDSWRYSPYWSLIVFKIPRFRGIFYGEVVSKLANVGETKILFSFYSGNTEKSSQKLHKKRFVIQLFWVDYNPFNSRSCRMECRCRPSHIFLFFGLFLSIIAAQAQSLEPPRYTTSFIEWITPQIEEAKEEMGEDAMQIPTSLIVAQAALESGWGKHPTAWERRNLFGIMRKKEIRSFSSYMDNIRFYLENLLEHRAYKSFRRYLGRTDSIGLVKHLGAYSENPEYHIRVTQIIRSHDLAKLDWFSFANAPISRVRFFRGVLPYSLILFYILVFHSIHELRFRR